MWIWYAGGSCIRCGWFFALSTDVRCHVRLLFGEYELKFASLWSSTRVWTDDMEMKGFLRRTTMKLHDLPFMYYSVLLQFSNIFTAASVPQHIHLHNMHKAMPSWFHGRWIYLAILGHLLVRNIGKRFIETNNFLNSIDPKIGCSAIQWINWAWP